MDEIRENIIQKRINIIQCDRCGTEFKNLRNLRCHFDKKYTCKPLLKDIPIEELKEKYPDSWELELAKENGLSEEVSLEPSVNLPIENVEEM